MDASDLRVLRRLMGADEAACCRYVTQEELASLSTYMRGRLTLDKVRRYDQF